MKSSFVSGKLIEIYTSIADHSISIASLSRMLDENFVSKAKVNRAKIMPLIASSYKGNIEILKFLISHEMYSKLTKREVGTLLEKAGDYDNVIGFDYLFNTLELSSCTNINQTFERCCSLGCLDMISYLLNSKENWNIDINKTSGLVYACYQERKNIVEYLLKNGADFSNNNYNAVTVAFGNDSLDILNYFLFEKIIDLHKMKECIGKLDVYPDEKLLYENFIQVIENAILTKKLTTNLINKPAKTSSKI